MTSAPLAAAAAAAPVVNPRLNDADVI